MVEATQEQTAIYDALRVGSDDYVIDALAGSGKTHTLIHALSIVPQKTILVAAFNKSTSEELTKRMPKMPKGSLWTASTFHAAGMRIINANTKGRKLELDKSATEKLIGQAIEQIQILDRKFTIGFPLRRAATRLLRLYKETYSMPEIEIDHVKQFGLNYDVLTELDDTDIEKVAYVVMRAYDLGMRVEDRESIDFCDMIWLPVVGNLKAPSRYQAVFVDELQDLSLLQWELVKKLVAPNGRLVGVGDKNQAIYGWRGAIGEQIYTELEKAGAKNFPLTTTFRCSRAVVNVARQLVPSIQPAPMALQGAELTVNYEDFITDLVAHDAGRSAFVLSRINSELIRVAIDLDQHSVDFDFLGGDEIMAPLVNIVSKLDKTSAARFRANLETWYDVEIKRAEKQGAAEWAEKIENYFAILQLMIDHCGPSQIVATLDKITYRSPGSPITLSSVHKAKGLEADDVYLMRQTFHRHQTWRQEKPAPEELRLEYVAITRSRDRLIWVESEPVRFRRR